MSRPRHLWSGDWEDDSAAVTEELGKRRGESPPPAEARPDDLSPPVGPSALERAVLWLRRERDEALERWNARKRRGRESARERQAPARAARTRRLRFVLLAVLVGLISGALAYGVTELLVGSGSRTASAASQRPWVGVVLENIPLNTGLMIADVVPGSPAAVAGLEPGDMITAIDGTPVNTNGDVDAAINHRHVGSHVQIEYTLGLTMPGSYTAQVTLAAAPPGYP